MNRAIFAFAIAVTLSSGHAFAGDIVQEASSRPELSTLVTAITAAGLADDLSAPNGPFTVFAPDNSAFASLPPGIVDKLLEPSNNDLLVKLLTYHVVSGSVDAATVVTLNEATTLQGESVKITANPKGVRINNANVTTTDIFADNGVIHIVDGVLLPKGFVGELQSR
jgi:uncharacterized surface protein with fasciclin (FAS1) repeats